MLPDDPGQGTGIDAVKPHDARFFQIVVQIPFRPEVGRDLTPLPHDVCGNVRPFAFKISGDHPVVADQRKGLHDNLPIVAGVGQGFQIAGHTGGENDLTRDLSLCTEAAALEHMAVLQHKVNAAIHMLPPLLPALRLPEPFLTNPTH